MNHHFLRGLVVCLACLFLILTSSESIAQPDTRPPSDISLAADGDTVAVAWEDGTLSLVSLSTNRTLVERTREFGGVNVVQWHPLQPLLTIATEGGGLYFLDFENGQLSLAGQILAENYIRKIVWHHLGKTLLMLGSTGGGAKAISSVKIWNADTLDLVSSYENFPSSIVDAAWSPTGSPQILISEVRNYYGTTLLLWNYETDTIEWSRHEPDLNATTIAWSPDSTRFALASMKTNEDELGNPVVRIHATNNHDLWYTLPTTSTSELTWFPSDMLAVAGLGTLEVWDVENESLVARFETDKRTIPLLMSSQYGARLLFTPSAEYIEGSFPVSVLVADPSLDRLNAIAELCVRDAATQSRAVTGLTSQRVDSLDALSDFVAQVESLPEGAIPPACRADLLAVAGALR